MWREALEKEFFVDPDIRKAETLPAYSFDDVDFLDLELKTVFSKTWLLVPERENPEEGSASTADFLKTPGSRVPLSLLGQEIFLQRDQRGMLHCFPNVCTHAWHVLVESPGVGGTIVCPQHGRRFDDAGRFLSQAGFENLDNFPRSSDHLAKVQMEEMGQFFFVCFENPLVSFGSLVGELQRSIPGIDLRGLRRQLVGSEVREVEGNWKHTTSGSSTKARAGWQMRSTFPRTRLNCTNGPRCNGLTLATLGTGSTRNYWRRGSRTRPTLGAGSSHCGGLSFQTWP